MKKNRRNFGILIVVGFLLATLLMWNSLFVPAVLAQKKTLRLYTTVEGTFSHAVGMAMIRVANKYNKDVEMVITTGKGSPASHSLYEKNETDTTYASNQALYEVWHDEGMFSKSPVKYRTYQTIYLYTADQFAVIKAGRTDIKSLSDLAGKRVFPYFRGSGSYDTQKMVLTKLGLWDKIIDRQMGGEEAADALKTGALDAIGGYSISMRTLPGWFKNVDARMDLQVVEPSANEKEKISKIPAITVFPPFQASRLFSKPVGVDKIWAYSTAYSFNFGPNEDADTVYGIVKAWYEHADELYSYNRGFGLFKEEGLDINVAVIDSMGDVPVHPGLAKYLKERGVWKSNWKIGELYPRPK